MRVHPSCGAALRIENLRGIVSPETSSGRSLVLPCPQLSWLHTRAVGPRRMSVMIRFDPSTTPRRNGRYLRTPDGSNRREPDIPNRGLGRLSGREARLQLYPREGPESPPSPKGPSPPFQTTTTRSATGHPRRDVS